jgi:hypothetical protein
MSKPNPEFASLNMRQLAALTVVSRELQARKDAGFPMEGISGEIRFTLQITGTIVQGKATDVPSPPNKDMLIRCLLTELTRDQKAAVKVRLANRRKRDLKGSIKEWLALVTPTDRIVRSGAITGNLRVIADNPIPYTDDEMMKLVDALSTEG